MNTLTPQQWYADSHALQCNGRRIVVRDSGQGETLLLIHGFPTSSWDWHTLWSRLSARYRLIAPDLLGFGRSDKPAGHRYSLIEQADLCLAVLQQRGVQHAHLLAHDYGDSVAQELLARAVHGQSTARIDSVLFLNGGLFPECHRPLLLQRLLLGPLGPLLARLTSKARFAASMRRIAGRQPPSMELIDAWWNEMQQDGGLLRMPALLRYIPERRVHRDRWVDAMQRSTIPLCFINGSVDPISGAHMAQRWRELLPQQRLIELPDCGHYPQLENADAVANAYLSWRQSLNP